MACDIADLLKTIARGVHWRSKMSTDSFMLALAAAASPLLELAKALPPRNADAELSEHAADASNRPGKEDAKKVDPAAEAPSDTPQETKEKEEEKKRAPAKRASGKTPDTASSCKKQK